MVSLVVRFFFYKKNLIILRVKSKYIFLGKEKDGRKKREIKREVRRKGFREVERNGGKRKEDKIKKRKISKRNI